MNKQDIHDLAVTRHQAACDADQENREHALDDVKHLTAEGQWDDDERRARELAKRPIITINRLPQFVRQVTGDIRKLNPALRILPSDNQATEETADLLKGLVRSIETKCDASSVYESAAESAAMCGMGAFRVRADYESGDSFDQELLIEPITNAFSVRWDPEAVMPTREDAQYCFIEVPMSAEDFEEQYPKASLVDISNSGDVRDERLVNWRVSGEVIVAEYFYIEEVERTIYLLPDGSVVEDLPDGVVAVRERKAPKQRVMWAKMSGKEILEGPREVASDFIPVVAVMGEEIHIGERTIRSSVIRYAKDPQRLYNYWSSAQAEMIGLQPKAPYLLTTKQIQGLENIWSAANDANRPYLPYHPDKDAPPPSRATPPVASQGVMQEIMRAADDMKATTGVYDAALGNRSSETSGIAIRQRQMESDVSTSIYSDNLAKSIRQAGRILLSMIPRIYDTQRVVKIVGDDDDQQSVTINETVIAQGQYQRVNDLTVGRYDVVVDVGPNYATRRQETQEGMMQFVQAFPAAGQVAGDLIAKAMDWPDADKLADRLKKMLPPGMLAPEEMPPEMAQQMQQQMAQQAQAMQIQEAGAQIEMRKSQAEAVEAEADAEKARFEAMEKQLELAIASGQMDAAIQNAVARALQGAMQPRL